MSFLDALLPKRCIFCSKPSKTPVCGKCAETVRRSPHKRDVIAPFVYEGLARKALHRYKFRRALGLAPAMAHSMHLESIGVAADVITWVPCSFIRRLTRGYDQCYIIAKELSKLKNLPLRRMLKRSVHSKPQYKMNGERNRTNNVAGAYKVTGDPYGLKILLIDDVYTTGATIRECKRVLTESYALTVTALCYAKVSGR